MDPMIARKLDLLEDTKIVYMVFQWGIDVNVTLYIC